MSQKFKIIKSFEDLGELDSYLMKDENTSNYSLLAIDTETNGIATYKDVVIGFSISANRDSGFYIPLLHWVGGPKGCLQDFWDPSKTYPENVTQKEYTTPKFISEFLARWMTPKNLSLIMHNAPFDILMIKRNLGVDLTDKVFCDTLLLKHVLDENTSMGLKETAILWKAELGIPVDEEANKEQIEMGSSVVKNGGKFNKQEKHIWRGDLDVVALYAIKDTALTYGLFEVGINKLKNEYEEKHFKWFFEDEVMPLCREVVVPMKEYGMPIDLEYFKLLESQTKKKIDELEDEIISILERRGLLDGFSKGKSIETIANKKRLLEYLADKEGLNLPRAENGKIKILKKDIQRLYAETNHWLYGYVLGEVECPYSIEELNSIKKRIYENTTNQRHRFNLRSAFHLQWLLCDKLKNDPMTLPQTPSSTAMNPRVQLNAEVVEEHFLKKYDFIKPLLTLKKLDKLYGTYISKALEIQHEGHLYVDMFQAGTISGRFSCGGGYNLQTLPRAENLEICPSCRSKNIKVFKDLEILANITCLDCKQTTKDIICSSVIKRGFVAPKGMRIIAADYAALEPRSFAEVSTDQRLKDIYLKDGDFYSTIYCDTEGRGGPYSKDPKSPNFLKKAAKDIRDDFKASALAVPYGVKAYQVCRLRGYKKIQYFPDGTSKEVYDVERGQRFIDSYLAAYPDLHKFMDKQIALAHSQGWVETLIGRRRHFDFCPKVFRVLRDARIDYKEFCNEKTKNLMTMYYKPGMGKLELQNLLRDLGLSHWDSKKKKERDWLFVRNMYQNELNNSVNVQIQGLAAHICNRAMIEATREFKAKNINAFVCLQVHDEIIIFADENVIDDAAKILQDCMEHNLYASMLSVPFVAEPKIADDLKGAK
jgi:DNA polymerase I-like protein with 3'-5' exonuclease and polymerase domains